MSRAARLLLTLNRFAKLCPGTTEARVRELAKARILPVVMVRGMPRIDAGLTVGASPGLRTRRDSEATPEPPVGASDPSWREADGRVKLADVNANRRPGLNPDGDSKFRLDGSITTRRARRQPSAEADATSMILHSSRLGSNPTRAIPCASAPSDDRRTA